MLHGAAQNENKARFLSELVRMCSKEIIPIIIGGDFTIIRGRKERNNDNYNDWWPFLFNLIIDAFNISEIELTGRKYTWTNYLQC